MHRVFVLALLVLGTLGGAQAALSAARGQSTQARVARKTAVVRDVYGKATQQKSDSGPEKNLNAGDILTELTTVKTGDNAAILLQLAGGHMFRVGENTKVILKELGKDKSFSFQVLAGNIWSAVRTLNQPTKYEVETPSAVAGVSGTVFAVFHDLATGQTTVSTNKGTVNVQQFNGQGRAGNVAPVGVGQYVQIGSTAPPAPGTQTGSGHNGQNNPVPTAAPVKRIVPLPAPTAFVRMWRTMRLNENWIGPLNGRGPGKLNQNIGPQLRMLKSPSVSAIRGNRSLAAPPVRQVPGKGAHRRTSAAPPVRQGSGNGEEHRKL